MSDIGQTHQLQTNTDLTDQTIQDKAEEASQNQILKPEETQAISSDNQNKINNNITIKLSKVELNSKIALEIFNEQISPILDFIEHTNKDLDQHKLEINMKHFDFKHSSLQSFGKLSQYADSNINNQQLKDAYHKSDENFPYHIQIRGDGNCFYRSFMINIMFMVIIQQNIEDALKIFQKVFKLKQVQYKLEKFNENQIDLTPEFKLHFLHFWMSKFIDCHRVLRLQQKYDLKKLFEEYNQHPFVDVSTVVICRNIILNKFNFLLKDPSYQYFITEESKANSPKYLLQYGQEAEDVIISIAAKAFQVDLKVKNIYRNHEGIFTDQFEYKFDENKVSNVVSVLFTKGHYNCLFEKQLLEQSIEKFNWPIEEVVQVEQQIQQYQQQDDNLELEQFQQYQNEVQEDKDKKLLKTDQQLDKIFGINRNPKINPVGQQKKEGTKHHQKTNDISQSKKQTKQEEDNNKDFSFFKGPFSIFKFLFHINFAIGIGLLVIFVYRPFKFIKSKL
ncbi:peptidase C65 otubain protein (macronuclear) [Tetrahymena thermophila SB210]|uniref:ubiquitinyl hydrolase 1 n=1 Tax=Tetrahymena thermophila (strain SB210) TaxID=312017 RepID=I7M060_TETTS|nr:peptidase C65 otubain protein [Tetrahymena thermophila SB210]EAR85541.2 peptidase C65 otubain protein [Tetrahymena thermophila SB210]|eukprot:XP_001033204.2 peptidase C65 otubain protein [Tetrahymena thermophila SB210]